MKLKKTEKYFHGVAGFIEDMAEISANYDKAVKRLEPFKGSDGYNQGMQEAQAQKTQRINEANGEQFREVAAKMREAIAHRPLVPPTPEQAALLSVLQMRQSLGRDELERAAQQMDGCPAALAVLDDLAQKHKVRGVRFNRELTADDLRSRIDTLERTALELIQEGARAASRAMPKDVISCLDRYGCFNSVRRKDLPAYASVTSGDLVPDIETIKEFCLSVDG